jgi:long-chain alkane monooxygenase
MARRPMHLVGFVIYGPMNHTVGAWRHPDAFGGDRWSWTSPQLWQSVGRTLEDGRFDAIFFADVLSAFRNYGGRSDTAIRQAVQAPSHEPMVLVPAIGVATERLGLTATRSITYSNPYENARTFATLDHMTNGRMGWNVVTSYHEAEAKNYGLDALIPHDQRYDLAEEFMEVSYQLWDSWDRDSVVMDVESGVYADPDKVHEINFRGEYFSSRGPLHAAPMPQGRPVIIQAGASPRGRDFAAKHAEYVFGVQVFPEAMKDFVDDMHRRLATFGRTREQMKILFGVQIILGETEDQARERRDALNALVTLDGGLALFSGHTAYDWSVLDLDEPLSDVRVPGIQGFLDMFTVMAGGRKVTLRDAATIYGRSIGMPQITGTPESVADQLEHLQSVSGCDGFQITPTVLPSAFEEIVDQLVPVLQSRGLARKEYSGTTLREHLQEF